MKKKLLFVTLLLSPLMAMSETTKAQAEVGEPVISTDDVEPYIKDAPAVRDQKILVGNPWGDVFLTSIPVTIKTAHRQDVTGIKVSLTVQCKGQAAKKVLLPATNFCNYRYGVHNEGVPEESKAVINTWTMKPELNIKQDGTSAIKIDYLLNGQSGEGCGAGSIKSVPVVCP